MDMVQEYAGKALPDYTNLVYQVGDEYWSVARAKFVDAPEDMTNVVVIGGEQTRANLREALELYGFQVGGELLADDELRVWRLSELTHAFDLAQSAGTVEAGGIVIDADPVAMRNIEGLIRVLEETGDASVMFCDAANAFHEVGLAQLYAMRMAVIRHGQELYAAKWRERERIMKADRPELLAMSVTLA